MKKLKFMLAAAAAIGLSTASQATVANKGSTDFEEGSVAELFSTVPSDDESEIVAGTPSGVTRPREFANAETGEYVLKVSTGTDPLLRDFDGGLANYVDASSNPVYIDTLVQFTVTPTNDTPVAGASDKLMIYLNASSNLVVKAATYSAAHFDEDEQEDVEATNEAGDHVAYYNGTPKTVEPNTWYRLTVTAQKVNGTLMFGIKLDGDDLVPGSTLDSVNGTTDSAKLFPSLKYIPGIEGGDAETFQLTSVGFAGEGMVDDLSLTTDDPFFTAVDFTFTGVSGVTATQTPGTDNWTFTAPEGTVIKSFLVNGNPVAAAVGATSYQWTATSNEEGGTVVVAAGKALTAAAHPWYEQPYAVVLAENLPGQTGNIVSAFHGQGEDEYLGLTYSTNPLQFDLFEVDGFNALVTNRSLAAGDISPAPGFRGVAISKALGVAMTLAYYTDGKMYVWPLAGGNQVEVTKPSTNSFDAAAFSPDGKYLFSNALNGESSNQFYVKWAVSNGGATLTKVGSISAGGRARNLAYARINDRDLVFAMADTGKVVVLDMTGDDTSAWSATDLITDLPALSYGTLCVSGVNASGATPKLTVATSTNNGATKVDVLNVYTLTVPASGAVSATLTKSFDEDALTAAGFGDISDANRYGNTVYVTDDDKTIYFARPDNKLYAAQFGLARIGNTLYDSLEEAVNAADTGDTVTTIGDCVVSNGNTGITFTKGINLVNNYTITIDGANYALRIANGTTTPVTMSGTGSLVWARGSGSPILVGCNEKKASYGINSFYEGSFVLNGGYLTSSDATAKGGNLVKLEAGTFVLNDGTINGGTRGVKADSEGNNATCVLTINGGTIVNTNSAAIAASTAGSGSSTVTVNAGTFTGKIDGAGMVTIPGTSTAKFDRDQSEFCESGYETTLSDGWYVVTAVAPSGEELEPGEQSSTTYSSQAEAEAALANVTIAASDAVEAALGDTSSYLQNFEAKAVEVEGGSYKVEVGLTTLAAAALQSEVNADAAEVVEDLDSATVTLTTTPGFYYSFEYGTTLGNMAEVGTRTLATGSTLTLTRPTSAGATAGFYKVLVNVAAE